MLWSYRMLLLHHTVIFITEALKCLVCVWARFSPLGQPLIVSDRAQGLGRNTRLENGWRFIGALEVSVLRIGGVRPVSMVDM
jgi:hypothetical protein